ncbi:MAG: molybdopterin-binding protein, partial [Microbacterium sp.]
MNQPGANGFRAAVITVSDRAAAGEREDVSGARAVDALHAAGFLVQRAVIVPDGEDSVAGAILGAVTAGARLVVTTGGTG